MKSSICQRLDNGSVSWLRRWVQIVFFLLLVFGGMVAINLGNQLPTFACVFDQERGGSCYLMGFQHQMALPYAQLFSGRGIGVLVGLATFVGFFLILNKAWCGFACPLGTLQDWLTILRKKMGIRYGAFAPSVFTRLKKIKYLLLALLIMLPMAMGNSIAGLPKLNHDFEVPFCMICPGRTVLPLFTGDLSQLVIDFSSKTKLVLTALGMVVTGLFFVGSFVKRRFFCLFCPMSAFHYIFTKLGLLRLVKDGGRCTRCGNCFRACDVGIHAIADDVVSRNIVKDDCMMCFKCVEVCPEDRCLQVRFLGAPVYTSTATGFFRRQDGEGHEH
ncbi:MAG: 4Fe-4S binding protein [Proteobacteria bacterium]|nr:4Fe-4S binding protein [Desulfobulbaceae bacterium]MBU4057878.1 4Fe-4S binding protein [Patescibacteria group bacterium]MBU4152690.1 4Fe-4S binding protein [Pseudomonadota bacterium]MDP2105243.1 4Fe-4S binding protein [Desulfobulbaceae bacterium]